MGWMDSLLQGNDIEKVGNDEVGTSKRRQSRHPERIFFDKHRRISIEILQSV